MIQEEWIDIKGYEKRYKVSSFGRIKSLSRNISYKNGRDRIIKEKILKCDISDSGYYRVQLSKNANKKWFMVSNIIADNFLLFDYKDLGFICDHIDGNKLNNRLNNLQIISQSENSRRYHESEVPAITFKNNKFIVYGFKSRVRIKIGEFLDFESASASFKEYINKNGNTYFSRPECKK